VSAVDQGSPVLEVHDIQVIYNRLALGVESVSLTLDRGQLVALLGSNGAGKTTTLRAISGFQPADRASVTRGEVLLNGRPVTGLTPDATARRGIALMPERDKVFTTLTVEENLMAVKRRGDQVGFKRTRAMIDELFPTLKDRAKHAAGYLSGGERQMLALARALLLQPRVLLVDELSFGLGPSLAKRLLETVAHICKSESLAVLLVEQNAPAALGLADYAYVMERGRIVLQGEASTLAADAMVREFYLGLSGDADRGYRSARRAQGARL
jgi:branched-chain amino acid transport system ATP-binding protein